MFVPWEPSLWRESLPASSAEKGNFRHVGTHATKSPPPSCIATHAIQPAYSGRQFLSTSVPPSSVLPLRRGSAHHRGRPARRESRPLPRQIFALSQTIPILHQQPAGHSHHLASHIPRWLCPTGILIGNLCNIFARALHGYCRWSAREKIITRKRGCKMNADGMHYGAGTFLSPFFLLK